MTKIAYNGCHGGFGLSHKGAKRYAELKGITLYPFMNVPGGKFNEYFLASDDDAASGMFVMYFTVPEMDWNKDWSSRDLERDDEALIKVIEEMGSEADGFAASLRIAELDSGTPYRIDEYDGLEWVSTEDSYEWKIAK